MKCGRNALAGALPLLMSICLMAGCTGGHGDVQAEGVAAPALSVAVTHAQPLRLPVRVAATGNVAAWREASIGAEVDGLRLVQVRVDVGDWVRRGDELAVFDAALVSAELEAFTAAVAQAEAEAHEAEADDRRAKELSGTGALSAQAIGQYERAMKTARARLRAARANEHGHRLRLARASVRAPGDGLITARMATVGAVIPAGQALFRMIEDGRLEWRAEVAAAGLDRLQPGQPVALDLQGRIPVQGRVRMLSPTLDPTTLNGMAYIDLPRDDALRAGQFVRGHVEVGERQALTLPQTAVLLRDGFHYVMQVGPGSVVMTKKVSIGDRVLDRIEITEGLSASDAVIASGLGFLGEGDRVRVVDEEAVPDATARTQRSPQVLVTARGGGA